MDRDPALRLRWWLVAVGIANLVAFAFVSVLLGGDALNGDEVNGRYFVAMHEPRAYRDGLDVVSGTTLTCAIAAVQSEHWSFDVAVPKPLRCGG